MSAGTPVYTGVLDAAWKVALGISIRARITNFMTIRRPDKTINPHVFPGAERLNFPRKIWSDQMDVVLGRAGVVSASRYRREASNQPDYGCVRSF
ncbi:MAG: hypothetical protein ACR2Q3_10915 [Woeseiaceae bacterium]